MNDQKEWEEATKALMVSEGWELDIEDDDKMCFCFKMCNGAKYIRGYFKHNRSFAQFSPEEMV